jgi:lipopolysaccharide export system protein LptA
MMAMKVLTFAFLIASSFAAASAAHAQIDRSEAPIEITSDTLEGFQKEGRGIYVGNVQAVQGNSRLTTDKLTVVCQRSADGECQEIQVLIAEGNVMYEAPDLSIRGDRGEYDYPTDTITLTGDVISRRVDDGSVISGNKMIYDVGEGRMQITATGKRVTSILNTAKKQPGDRPAPAPAPRRN